VCVFGVEIVRTCVCVCLRTCVHVCLCVRERGYAYARVYIHAFCMPMHTYALRACMHVRRYVCMSGVYVVCVRV